MAKITAEEARKLAGPTVEEYADEAFGLIRTVATAGKREAQLHGEFWERGGYSGTPEWKQACKILEDAGFEVRFFYEERQFVDMYTIVEW